MNDESMMGIKHYDGTAGLFQVLRWRQVLKSLQLERMDAQIENVRPNAYQAAQVFYAKHQKSPEGMWKIFKKSGKLSTKIDKSGIAKCLMSNCHGTNHHCMQLFRSVPDAVLRWRWDPWLGPPPGPAGGGQGAGDGPLGGSLAGHGTHGRKYFWALPKHDRERQLTQMFRSEYQQQLHVHHGDTEAFKMKYRFCGFDVCRDAFMKLTGTSSSFMFAHTILPPLRAFPAFVYCQEPQEPLEPHNDPTPPQDSARRAQGIKAGKRR